MELGVGELYPLFACMVTARSWESLSSQDGVSKKLTPKEVMCNLTINALACMHDSIRSFGFDCITGGADKKKYRRIFAPNIGNP